jgi:hypothetical protein
MNDVVIANSYEKQRINERFIKFYVGCDIKHDSQKLFYEISCRYLYIILQTTSTVDPQFILCCIAVRRLRILHILHRIFHSQVSRINVKIIPYYM